MRMIDVKVGMRLKATHQIGPESEYATVTELTAKGFKYNADADTQLGPRHGVMLKEGREHFGFEGEAYFEPMESLIGN